MTTFLSLPPSALCLDQIGNAFRNFHRVLRPGGACGKSAEVKAFLAQEIRAFEGM